MRKFFLGVLLFFSFLSCTEDEVLSNPNTSVYFPPIKGNTWETISVEELGWNEDQVIPLLNFLEEKNTKGFIILYNGKIVLENYFNNHSQTKPWYWASAGKTLTSMVTGIAEENGLLNINNKVSDYLGTGWTSCSISKENSITCKNLLTMTSGIDDGYGDSVDAKNLKYHSDAGTRWAYHNVYVKLQDVIASVSNKSFVHYFNENLKEKIGMTGNWIASGDFKIYFSTTRSMARFGLLSLTKGNWDSVQIINKTYFNNSIYTSQNINKAYGYLWWINGKESFHLPSSQIEFQGNLIPNAPKDMYAALGKNDQKIYVVPSKKLVVVRMGESAGTSNFTYSSFDNELWEQLNLLIK